MSFGQVVLGPPGSGKTTYCRGASEFLTLLGRKVAIINLDPACDRLPYKCSIDIQDLIKTEEVMDTMDLGPNGSLIYCIEYLSDNLDWLKERIDLLIKDEYYLLFDLPGQVELYTHHQGMRNILQTIQYKWKINLCIIHLVDSLYCNDPSTFISIVLMSLSTMCHIELPHINVLSKIDLLADYDNLEFGLQYYTDVLDLKYLLDRMHPNIKKLNNAICEIIESYSLVSFQTLAIENKDLMQRITDIVDKTNGYIYGYKDTRDVIGSNDSSSLTMDDLEYWKQLSEKENKTNMNKQNNQQLIIPNMPNICLSCGNKKAMKKCGKCKKVYFCNVGCQKKVWKLHKKQCISA